MCAFNALCARLACCVEDRDAAKQRPACVVTACFDVLLSVKFILHCRNSRGLDEAQTDFCSIDRAPKCNFDSAGPSEANLT